jgi:hypothetical protein
MSEQRRMRSELRQGLHQFLMQMYMSYAGSMDTQEAKDLIADCIEEQYEYFSKDALSSKGAKEALEEKIEQLTKKFSEAKDFDTQMYYSEKIDSLSAAIEILDMSI